LAKSSIKNQILEIESAMGYYPESSKILIIQKGILEILLLLANLLAEEAKESLSDEVADDILKKAVSSKNPMNNYLSASDFDLGVILDTAKHIVEFLFEITNTSCELERLIQALEEGEVEAKEAVDAILKKDAGWFQLLSERYGIDPSLLLLIFDSPMRPFFEDLARKVETRLIEIWWEPFCPVCGRQSVVARTTQSKRYMVCSYCGMEYLVNQFKCINCGNNDPTSLGFVSIEGHDEYELNYCEICKHYIKVLHEEQLRGKMPRGLEDLLTRKLDNFAISLDLGLKRA
jgi:FdhE protein